MGRGRGAWGPPINLTGTFNLVSGHAFHATLRAVDCIHLRSIKRENYLFMA